MTEIRAAVRAAGGVVVVAAALDISTQRLTNWTARGVPVEKCAAFEKAVGGRVTRADLRPSDWKEIWPELSYLGETK